LAKDNATVGISAHAAAWSLIAATGIAGCGTRRDIARVLASGSAAGFDFVLITLDTTRADRLGSYGYQKAQTPVLDRLAREGIRFADAVSPAPLTLAAHASILTGLDPQNHGARHNGQYRLDPSQLTLAEVLREKGYDTAAFVAAFVLDARYGLAQGFDVYDDRTEPLPGQPFGGLGERSAEKVTEAALAWLGGRAKTRPFFLWVHYYDPHAEYRPPEPYKQRFQTSLYDGEVAYMDAQIGRLIPELEKASEKLLVIVAGDHGESLGEHAEYTHSRLIYESTQHVPLFIWSPDLITGPYLVDDALVGLVDVFPTVLELLGIAAEGRRDGISLRLAGKEPGRTLYLETMAPYLDSGWAPLHALRRHQDKYIFAPRPEYYDLSADPDESDNLMGKVSGDAEQAVAGLREELAARLKDTPSAEAIAAAAAKPDAEALQRLQALGYLSGPGPSGARSGELPDPKDMMPIQKLVIESRSLRREGRLDDALSKAKQALERSSKDLEVLEEIGLVYVEMDRLDEAEPTFRQYVSLKPNPNINILLAEILAETGRRTEGEALLKQAMELEPDHGGVMITYGDLLAKRRQYAEALEWYQKAKRVDPYRTTAIADKRIVELRRRAGGS
jgi:arylsulfatase A-like enzyme